MASKHMEDASYHWSWGKQIKTVRYHLTSISMSKIRKTDHIECWWRCRARGIFRHCWWELMQDGTTSSEACLAVSLKLNVHLCHSTPRYLRRRNEKYVHARFVGSDFICNSPQLEGPITRWVNKEAVACSTKGNSSAMGNELLTRAAAWMILRVVMLSKINQTQIFEKRRPGSCFQLHIQYSDVRALILKWNSESSVQVG